MEKTEKVVHQAKAMGGHLSIDSMTEKLYEIDPDLPVFVVKKDGTAQPVYSITVGSGMDEFGQPTRALILR